MQVGCSAPASQPPALNIIGLSICQYGGTESASVSVILSGGVVGFTHFCPRYTAGPLAASYSKMGRRISWRVYQSVFKSDVFATTTSLRIPSTSWAYQSGNVSLSPTVTSTPYGSTEFRRSCAKSAVSVWPARDAVLQLVKSGMSAMARSGA